MNENGDNIFREGWPKDRCADGKKFSAINLGVLCTLISKSRVTIYRMMIPAGTVELHEPFIPEATTHGSKCAMN